MHRRHVISALLVRNPVAGINTGTGSNVAAYPRVVVVHMYKPALPINIGTPIRADAKTGMEDVMAALIRAQTTSIGTPIRANAKTGMEDVMAAFIRAQAASIGTLIRAAANVAAKAVIATMATGTRTPVAVAATKHSTATGHRLGTLRAANALEEEEEEEEEEEDGACSHGGEDALGVNTGAAPNAGVHLGNTTRTNHPSVSQAANVNSIITQSLDFSRKH